MDRLPGEGGGRWEGRGRLWWRLNQFGDLVTVVVCKHNELSDGGHFILAIAASWVAYKERCYGLLAKDRQARRGVHQEELRRQLATVTLRAGMQLFLSRLN